jgi:hypothetical protein
MPSGLNMHTHLFLPYPIATAFKPIPEEGITELLNCALTTATDDLLVHLNPFMNESVGAHY